MAVATPAREGAAWQERPRGPQRTVGTRGRRGGRLVPAAAIGVGVGMMYLVGRDGSPAWQLFRLTGVALLTWLTLVGLIRGRRARRGSIAFAAGLVGVAVGAGIGLPHLAKVGLTSVTVAGLLALAGGLVLLPAGLVLLARAAGRWRGALVVPVLLFTAFVGVWSLGQAVAATNVPRPAVGSTTPADLGLSYRDVAFPTRDGVTLSGWYVPSTNGAAVVLLHGAGSTRSSVLDHAVVLARDGYGVLLFDARGHGRSDGRAMDFGWYGDEDTAAAVSFLARQDDVDDRRIAAVGMSMGGEEAIGAAADDERIRAVVAEGATNRVPEDKAWLSDQYGWRGAIQEGVEWLLYNTTDLLTAADQPIALRDAARAAAPRPALLIAAGTQANEGDAGRYIQAGSPGTVELWVVDGAGHTGAIDTDPEQWAERVTSFLAEALGLEDGADEP